MILWISLDIPCIRATRNPCAITIEWIDKTNLRDNPRGILSIHEKSSLEFENERNNSEHRSYFINTSPSPCSYKTSPQSIGLSNLTTFEISNPLFLSIYKNFKRAVVDAYVYIKYCRSRWVYLDIGQRWRGNHFADINWWFPKDKLSVLKQALIRS
jgi:hypothetical protein